MELYLYIARGPIVHSNPSRSFSKSIVSCDFPAQVSLLSHFGVFKFLWGSDDGNHLISSQSETSVFKFIWSSVDRKHLMSFQRENTTLKLLQCSVDAA